VAYLLNCLIQLTLSHDDITADVTRFLNGNGKVFLRDGTPFNFQENIATANKQTIHSYLNNMSRQGTSGNRVTLIVIACIYNV
jgi:hypothetical protein